MAEERDTFDVMAPVDRQGKTRWIRIGIGWGKTGRKGYQVSIQLDSLPMQREWEGKLVLFKKDESDQPAHKRSRGPAGLGDHDPPGYNDSDIPF
jgi:hypothetical protein